MREVSRAKTVQELIDLYELEKSKMSLVHYAHVLNRFNAMVADDNTKYVKNMEIITGQIASHLLSNLEFLDPTTVMKLMSVLAHPSFNLNVRLGDKLLGAVEDKIEADMPEYMNLDVS